MLGRNDEREMGGGFRVLLKQWNLTSIVEKEEMITKNDQRVKGSKVLARLRNWHMKELEVLEVIEGLM